MNTEEFVKAFYEEKENLLKEYTSENTETAVGLLVKSLKLTDEQNTIMIKLLESVVTDVYYSTLLGLDGSASIGRLEQQAFTIYDEEENQICGGELEGDIEGFAYEYFYKNT